MSSILLVNGSHWNESRRAFVVPFGSNQRFNDRSRINISQVAIYHSFPNVSAERGNNTLLLRWPTSGGQFIEYNFELEEGYYTITSLNNWLKSKCKEQGLYTLSAQGAEQFYTFCGQNSSYQNLILLTQIASTATPPEGAAIWEAPDVSTRPQIDFITTSLSTLFGYSTTELLNNQNTSDQVEIQPINSLVIGCNMVNDSLSQFPDTLCTVPIAGKGWGSLISYTWPVSRWQNIVPGAYRELILRVSDENSISQRVRDTNCLFLLSFKEEETENIFL